MKRQLHWAYLKIQVLEERLRLQRIQKYGRASERLSDAQLELLEMEPGVSNVEVQAESAREPLPPPARTQRRRPHPGRQELPADLPRMERVIACAPEQCQCSHCGQPTTVIGHETSEQLDVEPAKYFVLVTKREKRACRHCEQGGVAAAPAPARIIEKGLVSDRVVIDTVISKYSDHRMPRTHRQRWRCGAVREMREGPLGACDQEPAPNHRELLSLRAMVVNVAGKGGTRSRQVWSRETSESKPSMKCRNCTVDVKTGDGGRSGTSRGGDLKTGPGGIRLEGGVNLDQALTRNVGTCRPDAKGASRAGDPRQALSTEAGHRGRTARSRDEGAVMALDRRGCGVSVLAGGQPAMGGAA